RYRSLAERLDASKSLLYLCARKSNFIGKFDPPENVVCYPFYKVNLGTQCPFDCAYCYLQLTYRIQPIPRSYLNLEKLFSELKTLAAKSDRPIVLNAGELSDPLALDGDINIVNDVIEEISKYENIKLLLLTKSDKTDHLIDLRDRRSQVILSASLTSPLNQDRFERGTASIDERLHSLKVAADKGYRIRVRIDPIINSHPDWLNSYENGLIKPLVSQIKPELITLGQPRFYSPLLNLASKRFPEQNDFWSSIDSKTKDHRIRSSFDERKKVYISIIEMLKDHFGQGTPDLALCKEDPDLIRALGIKQKRKCNCLP
ncbi:radical SAM protein, partial [bacterium]|nr:radical SAM protein [bacterium]